MDAQDILLDDSGDLSFSNGDFSFGVSDQQHLMLIVNLSPGSIKQFPLQGVGINYYLGSTGQEAALNRDIKVKSTADGYIKIDTQVYSNEGGIFDYSIISAERP